MCVIAMAEDEQTTILSLLGDRGLEQVLQRLTYEDISKVRMVSRKFNAVCGGMLTKGFYEAEKKYKEVDPTQSKSPLPLSKRIPRRHLADQYAEVQETLALTYGKYIENKQGPFIPGKVLDQMFRVLECLAKGDKLSTDGVRLLDELKKLSFTARKHFDKTIAPGFHFQKEMMSDRNANQEVQTPYRQCETGL